MNKKKLALMASVILGLALVSLMVAVPAMAQNGAQNGEALQTGEQQQLQTQDCQENCTCNGTQTGETQRIQERLRTQECSNQSISNGTQLQNRARLNQNNSTHLTTGNGTQATAGNGTEQNTYQYRYRHGSP
jgi:hypothetical protein